MKTCKKERNKNKRIAEHNHKAAAIIAKSSSLNDKTNNSVTIPVVSSIYFKYKFGNKKEIIFSDKLCYRFQLDTDGDTLTLIVPLHMSVTDAINKVLKG
ncbi:hypothetical protein GJ23_gp33 [Lactococcus phage P118]|uniref:Uncharacterized protein n=1 Tax=Lactococcus phage P118 TaxID=1476888 RepID=X4YGW6_9CAUD|nr:hypothetical protein GJ23_gp33 [Lactococcus phage P118]AHV83150.1 hypothetical protein P118_0033 [Lactococcus phage P118]